MWQVKKLLNVYMKKNSTLYQYFVECVKGIFSYTSIFFLTNKIFIKYQRYETN